MDRKLNNTPSCYKIVLIDDDPICHLISEKMIKRFSLNSFESFINAADALEKLKWRANHLPEELPDFILLDIDMPQMDGWQFLDEFDKMPASVKERITIFILSSSCHHNDKKKANEYSIVRNFFSKPLTAEQVEVISNYKDPAYVQNGKQ